MTIYAQYNNLKKISIDNIKIYFILEEDFFLSYEIQTIILVHYAKKNFHNIIKISITSDINWNILFHEYQQMNLFKQKKILIVTINKIQNINHTYSKINYILQYNNPNIILILRFLDIHSKNKILFLKNINDKNQIIIHCPYLTIEETKQWVKKKIIKMNININTDVINILSFHYEKNLLMLFKTLQILKIINFNTNLTKKYILGIIKSHKSFNIKNWIHALFAKNKLKAIQILYFLKKKKYKISYLIQSLKNNLIYLIHLKENYIYKNYLNKYNKNIIFDNKNNKYQEILENINYIKIYKIINTLTKIELHNKKFQNELLWEKLKTLILIF